MLLSLTKKKHKMEEKGRDRRQKEYERKGERAFVKIEEIHCVHETLE